MPKAIFISTTNIYDKAGNGGVKASREHYDILADYFGEDNILSILFVNKQNSNSIFKSKNLIVYERPDANIKLLLAALFGCRVYMPWDESRIITRVDEFEPDLVFLDFSVAGRLISRLKKYKTMCFFHNVESDYTFNKMKNEGLRYYPAYLAALRNDKWGLEADKVLCFNDRDSKRLFKLYGKRPDYVIPISLSDRFAKDRCISRYERRILFLGSCFGPNEDGIEWFMEEVMPELASNDIYLDIVGLGFEKKKGIYSKYKNVNVIGTAESIDEYYYSHAIVVMPIRYGAGMKVKTAEAMMFGRYIIASDEALEGYDVREVEDVKSCNTQKEYVHAILELFEKNDFKLYSESSRSYFLNYCETGAVQKKFYNALSTMIEK